MNNKFEVVELNNDQRVSPMISGFICPTGLGCPEFNLGPCYDPGTECPVKQCCTDPNGFGCYTDYNCGPDSIDDRRDF
jgi:hypothetical protein